MTKTNLNKLVLLGLVAAISLLFLGMIAQFLMAILMAGLFAALTQPVFHWLTRLFGGRRYLAASVNLILLVLVVLLPLTVLAGVVIAQAVEVGKSVTPVAVQFVREPETVFTWLHKLPFYHDLMTYEDTLRDKLAASIEAAGTFLVNGISVVAIGTANLLFMSVVFLYTFFFFQLDGHKVVHAILYYLPLEDRVERRLLTKFTLVTQAMIKGTLLIGLLQGALAGIAFGVAGVPHAVFWGTVMAVLSIVPGIGSAVVWVPASIILMVQGHAVAGIGLFVFCALVVGSIDNVLRPILVGKDTNMHELMIFFGTLGGLVTFGMSGLLIGPVIASLFLTVWEIYGEAFRDVLPQVGEETMEAPVRAIAEDGLYDDETAAAMAADLAVPDGGTSAGEDDGKCSG
ncbi:MAG: AI-2E family transporter [Thiohalocapsa sp.]|uniref:AI-2E family transporter n=1 Tax=Thiohalocapsa sp. TaxID=2497641 RepID=UPI0025DFB149|nr:AI-2E family transporter [Thiohalocapsa sp.]MCG6942050.1 AI-2E family transporter [Thiohalocapsa sp.]